MSGEGGLCVLICRPLCLYELIEEAILENHCSANKLDVAEPREHFAVNLIMLLKPHSLMTL